MRFCQSTRNHSNVIAHRQRPGIRFRLVHPAGPKRHNALSDGTIATLRATGPYPETGKVAESIGIDGETVNGHPIVHVRRGIQE